MDFLPVPQKVTYGEGVFPLRFYTRITLVNTTPSALLYAQMLQSDLRRYAGLEIGILHEDGKAAATCRIQ